MDKSFLQINRGAGRNRNTLNPAHNSIAMSIVFILFQSSSCLSDREEEDLYDYAAKYEGGRSFQFGRYNFAGPGKSKISPSGYVSKIEIRMV